MSPADLRLVPGAVPTSIRWTAPDAATRGPVIGGASSVPSAANAIGIPGGAFAPYRALAVVTGALSPVHRPDLADTEPVAPIGPFPQWSEPDRIVTLDPWGHRVATDFAAERDAGLDIRPSIAVASGQLRMMEIAQALAEDRLRADGDVLSAAGDARVTKIAIEPVWWLPGLARRLGVDEAALRSALVHETGGQYPVLVTRPELELFLPPIGSISVYLFGDPARLNDPSTPITARVHDECSGSDVFGSDLCTCRPYLAHGIEECIRNAQEGGLGVIVYNRKEGRALGEVVKYLVYNARPRGICGDRHEDYFARTRHVAGVEDMRFQSLAVDPLHWLGIARVDRWVSMSDMKSRALEAAGIAIGEQIAIPDDLVPTHAHVEIEAKKAAGYFF